MSFTEQTKQLEDAVHDLEEQLQQQSAGADEAISIWERRCTELQGSFDESQLGLEACRTELLALLKTELGVHDKLLASYDHDFEVDLSEQEIADADEEVLKVKLRERNYQLEHLVAKQDSDINALFVEMETLRSNENKGNDLAKNDTDAQSSEELFKSQIVELQHKSQIAELQMQISDNEATISQLEQSLAMKEERIQSLESKMKEEEHAKAELQSEIRTFKEKLSLSLLAEEEAHMHAGDAATEKDKLQESLAADRAKIEKLNERLSEVLASEQEAKEQLEKVTAENNQLRESVNAEEGAEKQEHEQLEKELIALKNEKNELQIQVERLTSLSSGLEDDLREANNAMEVYIAKEVSDKATEMATHALRHQLVEMRRQSDTDHSAYLAEKEARIAAESEVERLRTDLRALVDVSEHETEIYGADALVIKAADKINRKERLEIAELQASLSRAMSELRTSRAGEKDAEERAAKAAHHIVVCEQDLAAAKSELTFFLQTMDETRQDEESKRASLEHRIRTLENDLDVMRRFHSSETDSLRNELTQAVMEKDRSLQLLKDSEKNKTAMVFAASKDYSASSNNDSPEAELSKLRIEKAQLLVAAADEGARTERRLRDVLATELSSSEADILVERERRLAAEAACDNMKLLVAELQKDVQSYRDDSVVARNAPSKTQMEKENARLMAEIQRVAEENASLRTKLDAAEKAQENAQYRIEKLTADCRIAQASISRLDREIKFNAEMNAEMGRMRPSPQPKQSRPEEDPAQNNQAEDFLPSVVDQLQHQTEAIEKERELYRSLQLEHEELLALLGQTEEVRSILERALQEHVGQEAVEAVLEGAKASIVAQYGSCVEVTNQ